MNLEREKPWKAGAVLIFLIGALVVVGSLLYLLYVLAEGVGFAYLPRTRFEWISSLGCYGLWILYRAWRGN